MSSCGMQRICPVEMIERRQGMGMGWQPVSRTLIGETHQCTFLDEACTLKPASVSVSHPNDGAGSESDRCTVGTTRSVGCCSELGTQM